MITEHIKKYHSQAYIQLNSDYIYYCTTCDTFTQYIHYHCSNCELHFKSKIEAQNHYALYHKLWFLENDCILGLFAIRCKYLKTFEYTEEDPKSPEVQFAEYVRENVPNIMEIQNLGMECCFAGNLSILVV
jgi:hypothetical protein